MRNELYASDRHDMQRWKAVTRFVVGGVFAMWLAAAILVWGLVPYLAADPSLAESVNGMSMGFGIFALIECIAGGVALFGLALVWRAPRPAVGQLMLLIGGLVAASGGLVLLNLFTLQAPGGFPWSLTVALTVGIVTGAFIVVGLLAVAAALWRLLPGESIAERMMLSEAAVHARASRALLVALTAALVISWVALANALLTSHGLYPFLGLQFGMPTLAGVVVAGWSGANRNQLKTLGWASLAGVTSSCLFLLTLIVEHYYRFNPVGYFVWWGLIGALFGALGFGLWQLFTNRRLTQAQTGLPA